MGVVPESETQHLKEGGGDGGSLSSSIMKGFESLTQTEGGERSHIARGADARTDMPQHFLHLRSRVGVWISKAALPCAITCISTQSTSADADCMWGLGFGLWALEGSRVGLALPTHLGPHPNFII